MNTTTDQDENGIAERQEQLIQQRMSAMLTTDLIFSLKRTTIHQATQLKHLGLYIVACIPEPVNDVDKLKQRVIEVLDGCVQQTVVYETTGEQKRTSWVCSHVK